MLNPKSLKNNLNTSSCNFIGSSRSNVSSFDVIFILVFKQDPVQVLLRVLTADDSWTMQYIMIQFKGLYAYLIVLNFENTTLTIATVLLWLS